MIDNILSCEIILSSSLHGLIVADAYNTPSSWIKFSNKVYGNGFKFRDYYASIGYEEDPILDIEEGISCAKIHKITLADTLLKAYPNDFK